MRFIGLQPYVFGGEGTDTSQGIFSSQKSMESQPSASHQCPDCSLVKPLIQKILSGVHSLENEVHRASTTLRQSHFARQVKTINFFTAWKNMRLIFYVRHLTTH